MMLDENVAAFVNCLFKISLKACFFPKNFILKIIISRLTDYIACTPDGLCGLPVEKRSSV
jgi:hypothetical protein